MKKLALIFLMALPFLQLSAQFTTVTYDYELSTFNDNQPLPAESTMLIAGSIPDAVEMVEIEILTHQGNEHRAPLYVGTWKRPYNKPSGDFRVPVNYRLQASKRYDFTIRYFQAIGEGERKVLYKQLISGLGAYIDQIIDLEKDKFKLDKSPRQAVADMDEIVWTGMENYRSRTGVEFPGFSDIIRERLEDLKNSKIQKSKMDSVSLQTSAPGVKSLRNLVDSEIRYVLNDELVKVSDTRFVDNYETEDRPGYFSINAGYGGIYLGGNIENLDYDAAPYLSLGFPLATSRIAPALMRNSSLTFGVFLDNFSDENGNEISGPIIERPMQFSLDYKIFQFVRFNAGAAFLEKAADDMANNGNSDRRIFIKPFIGISGKINIQLSLDK